MAVLNGSAMLLLLGDTGNAQPVGCTKSATLTINMSAEDASCKSSAGWRDSIPGQRSWDIALDGLYDPDGVTNFDMLYDQIYERDQTLIMEFAEIDGTGGGRVYRGNVLVTSTSFTAEMETPMTYTGALQGTGPLYKSTVASS
jgi:predicted secreted protein